MNKEKFDALARLGLTKEEAREWINHLCNQQVLRTPLPLVYKLENGCYEVLSYLDLSRKNEVFGILSGDVIWSLVGQKKNINYYDAQKMLKENKDMRLPSPAEFRQLESEMDKANTMFTFLIEQGITCDYFNSEHHWASHNELRDDSLIYSFRDNAIYKVDPTRRLSNARLCIDYYFNGKVI